MAASTRVIKKYPNRRLYDTAQSAYITLAEVKQLVLDQVEFQVIDAKTGDDLTRAILLQIILEEESGLSPMFSSDMLAQMIRFYGNAVQGLMGNFMEQNIHAFLDIQRKLQEQTKELYGDQKVAPEVWKQFLQMQTPAMQGVIGNYLEHSANLFLQMQQQMQKQAQGVFGSFPPNFGAGFGFPGFGAPSKPDTDKK